MTRADSARYTSVAVALHWAIAVLILGNIAGGVFMHNLPNASPIKYDLYQLHKSFGLMILLLTIVRLGWRVVHAPPPLPPAIPGWRRLGARAAHWAFYGFMLVAPLTGWAMVSVSPLEIPTYLFGVVPVPHLPFLGGVADRAGMEELFAEVHESLAFAMLALLALHVGAALKHHFSDRDGVLRSMLIARRDEWAGLAGIFAVLGLGALIYALVSPTDAAPAASGTAVPAPQASSAGGGAPLWSVDYDASRLGFAGTEKGRAFAGSFGEFAADIRFDPDDLEASGVSVVVAAQSASTGDANRDSTMPGSEWFATREHPAATFVSEDIRAAGAGAYEAHGVLTIKEYSRDIVLDFTLAIDGEDALARGGVDLVRTDFGLGLADSWLNAEGVALEVRVDFEIAASRAAPASDRP